MGRRLKKTLKTSGFDLISRDNVAADNQPSLSSRLRSWLGNSSTKYAVQKSDAMRAIVSIDELHRQKQASSFCRNLDECRRERRAYLERRIIAKQHDAVVKLANAELRQEARRKVYDELAMEAEKTAKHHGAAIEQAVIPNQDFMEDLGLDSEEKLGAMKAEQEQELADLRSRTEEACNETATMLAEVRDEAEREDQIVMMNFQQECHQQTKQAREEFDDLKTLLSAKISDLDIVSSLLLSLFETDHQ